MTRVTIATDFSSFAEAAGHGNLVPVFAEKLADLLTPVGAMMQLSGSVRRPFLLESAEGAEHIGRYSFLGGDPFLEVVGDAKGLTLVHPDGRRERLEGDPVRRLAELQGRYRALQRPGLPPFSGGAVGYVAYDAVRWIEDIPDDHASSNDGDWLHLAFYDTVLAFDHLRHRVILVANGRVDDPHDRTALRAAYSAAVERVESLADRLCAPVDGSTALDSVQPGEADELKTETNLEHDAFCDAVQKAKHYIAAGDAFQIVLSRQLRAAVSADPLTVYRTMRAINPSPYMFCLDTGDVHVVGSSPEMLIRVQDGGVETRPIAGTRRRSDDPFEDQELAEQLLADEKERAEHLMLVDLGRNDIGRVAEYGSVEVPDFMKVERYSHVMHLVSSVRGKLRPGVSPAEALFASFPAGTVSGAPKVRAMEIIDELENRARGIYAGAVLYSDFAGNLNSCITIRTLAMSDGQATVQAGAGIVADSKPEREFEETREKAAAALQALAWAEAAVKRAQS